MNSARRQLCHSEFSSESYKKRPPFKTGGPSFNNKNYILSNSTVTAIVLFTIVYPYWAVNVNV